MRAVLRGQAAELSTKANSIEQSIEFADPLLETLRTTISTDPDYVTLLQTVQQGFPKSIGKTHEAAHSYCKVRDLRRSSPQRNQDRRPDIPTSDHPGTSTRIPPRNQKNHIPGTPNRLLARHGYMSYIGTYRWRLAIQPRTDLTIPFLLIYIISCRNLS